MANIRITLEADTQQLTSAINRAGQQVMQFQGQIGHLNSAMSQLSAAGFKLPGTFNAAGTAAKGFLSTLRDISVVVGAASIALNKLMDIQNTWVGSLIKTNVEFERLVYQMRSMSTAADPVKDAAQQVNFLRKSAMDMPFALKTINDAFVKLKATGTDPLNGSLKSIADGVAAFGGTDEAFQRVVLGLSQMSGKGVIQMEELRQQLGEQMPTAVAIMARSMGVSMSKLIKDISTGTLSSREALDAFYRELDRAYGGRAQYMMQTFSGQVKRLETQMQTLALVAGGIDLDTGMYKTGGLMDTLRAQLRDINNLLSSKTGTTIAEDIGKGLSQAIIWLRQGIEFVVKFRNEIFALGKSIAVGFSFVAATRGLNSFTQSLLGLSGRMSEVGKSLQLSRNYFSLMAQAINGGATVLPVLRMGLLGVRSALVPMIAGFAAVAPWVAALGIAVYTAAEYFGIFKNKTDEAYESLVKYGAETRRQVLEVGDLKKKQLSDNIEALKAERDGYQQEYDNETDSVRKRYAKENLDEAQAALDAKVKELEDVNKKLDAAYTDAAKHEDDVYVRNFFEDLNERIQAKKTEYNNLSNETQAFYDKQAKAAIANNQSTAQIEEERGKKLREIQLKEYDDEIEIYERIVKTRQDIAKRSFDPVTIAQSEKIITAASEHLKSLYDLRNATQNQQIGTFLNPKALNDDKLMARGEQMLERLRAKTEGFKAEIEGASGAVAKLQYILDNNPSKFGDERLEKVRQLKEELIQAQAEADAFDKILSGKNKLDRDVQRAKEDAQNRIEEAQKIIDEADGLGKSEIITRRINDGFYEGFGPKSKVMQWLSTILKAYDAQGGALNQLGQVARDNTFGDRTVLRIRTTADALGEVASQITMIGTGLNGLDWNKMAFSGDTFLPGGAMRADWSKFGGGILDLIAKVESGGNYNATLDNGRWTNGAQNLTAMTLNEVRQLQRQMLANPLNRATYRDERGRAVGSSALGRYQIVGSTLDHLMKTMGLSGNELFDEKMQDAMAKVLLQRRGANPNALRAEWAGLKNVDDATIMRALGSGDNVAGGPRATAPAAAPAADTPVYTVNQATIDFQKILADMQAKINDELKETADLEKKANSKEDEARRVQEKQKLLKIIEDEKNGLTKVNSLEREITESIKKGKLGDSRDPKAAEYKEIIKLAQEADAAKKRMQTRDSNNNKIDRFEEESLRRQLELSRRLDEAKARIKDPDQLKSSSEFRQLERDYDQYLSWIEQNSGRESDAYKKALNAKHEALVNFRNVEVNESAAKWTQESREINRGLMTERQARQAALQQEIDRIDAEVAAFQGTEDQKVLIVKAAEEKKAALRAQAAAADNPLTKQMQEWSDLQGNLAKQSTQWMDSLAGGLTDLIMGTGDLKSAINGILRSMINMGVKYLMSQLMQGKSQAGVSAAGGKKGATQAATGGKKSLGALVGVAHTGGIIGRSALQTRMVNPRAFVNAPTYHTGGVIGGRKFSPDEVPIVARRGEGVFTEEQMAGMGGGNQVISIAAPITVNGSAGTPEQNQDLAKRMAKQMEGTVRGVVADEMRKQMRPGNMLKSKAL